ncbi:Alpha/beta hydrolase family protein [Stigmatella aurantiaca]|uniref:Alpha/beta hydrolase family protein n=1 Tax=Stigmatella aurantiaca TaxID=41 RepID=A0A1H7VN55_STIAU|nr:alpha/beta fold hydrolase [Stigmatella aurantiaca]SEM10319.1 Alpha/beta hydrolase family protein [Stigmatella aurantiaca]
MNRRNLLKGTMLVTAALPLVGSSEAHAAPRSGSKTFVLVHGAWHNSLHWGRVAQHLSGLGHRVVSLDLPGHGLNACYPSAYLSGAWARLAEEPSPVRDITLEACALAVVNALQSLQGGARPILVGHSVGGAVITRAGELAPERVGRLVYLTAYCPVRLKVPSAYGELPEAKTEHGNSLFVGNPATLGAARINPRGDAAYLEALRAAYYNDVETQAFLPFALALTPDLPLGLWTSECVVTRERWGRIPRSYIRCTLDRATTPAIQDLMIREADAFTPGNRFEQKTLESSHSPFASQPGRLAEVLASLR